MASPLPPTERPSPGVLHWAPPGPAKGRLGLLHGVVSSAGTWWRTGPALAGLGWDVTAVDLPGHGEGPRPATATGAGEGPGPLHELAAGALGSLPPGVHVLVGHSLGAVVALTIASLHPGFANGLVLEDPPAPSAQDGEAMADMLELGHQAVLDDREAYAASLRSANPGWAPGDLDQAVGAMESCDVAAVAGALRAGLSWDLASLVASAPVPVLVLAAPEAPAGSSTGGGSALAGGHRAAVRSLVGEDRFVTLPGGHSLHRDHSDAVVDLVDRFARQLLTP